MTAFDLQKVEAAITGTQFAGHLKHFPTVRSTNALALEAAQAGARDGVYIADEQTAGRGRGGHSWHSTAADGLYVSALVTPQIPIKMGTLLSLAAGLAAQSAIANVSGLVADIRWPNDLLLRGLKCGGVLVETASVAGGEVEDVMLRYAVIGVGINLNHESFPPDIALLATSLRKETRSVMSSEALLIHLLRSLDEEIRLLIEEYVDTPNGAGLLRRFAAASTWVRGKHVHVDEDGGYTGVTNGLDPRGFLKVAGDDGILHTVLSGGVREQ